MSGYTDITMNGMYAVKTREYVLFLFLSPKISYSRNKVSGEERRSNGKKKIGEKSLGTVIKCSFSQKLENT